MGGEALGTAAIFAALTTAISWLGKRLIDGLQKERDECRSEVKDLRTVVAGHAEKVERIAEERASELAALKAELAALKADISRRNP